MLELINPGMYSFSKYLWSTYYLPGNVLATWDGYENESHKSPTVEPTFRRG